jgi:TonB family protein
MAHSAPHSLAAAAGFVSPALSQRAVILGVIVAFHIVLVYLLASGLGATSVNFVFEPIKAKVYEDPPDVAQPPPPPDPTFVQPRVDVGPPPDISIAHDIADTGTALTLPAADPQPVTPPAVQTRIEPIHVVGRHQLPNTEDYYPPSLRRLGVEGATNVNVCVDERGKRTGEPTVIESSGNARLDEGALDVARAGRYARSARGATFVPNCYGFRIIFKMQ